MDLSRSNTLSLNNSNDIIAHNISLINGNITSNILDLFAFRGESDLGSAILIDSVYNKIQTYNKLEINALISNISGVGGYSDLSIDNLLSLKQNVIGLNSLNIDKINGLQTDLDTRATITNMNNALALKQQLIGVGYLNINQVNLLQSSLDSKIATNLVYS